MLNLYPRLAPNLLSLIELLLVIAAGALIAWSQRSAPIKTTPPALASLGRAFKGLARRRTLAVFAVGASVIALRVALIPFLGIPEPRWHDEYSFLLAADTFAHGRLTNPTHPMWMYFESFHIIHKPTYMSMYPPGQGIVLAAGQLLGHPWIGELFATGLMCSALCWMLQAWLPPGWALFGASLAALRLAILSYWMNTYFCGSLAALAGALVLGALPRIQSHARFRDAVAMGLGLALLANTRPYEGFLFSIPVAIAMLIWIMRQQRIPTGVLFQRVVLPLVLMVGATGAAMGYYFWRVTGDAFTMPYQVNRSTYAVAPYFAWQKMRPAPIYRYDVMRRFYLGLELRDYEEGRSALGFLRRVLFKIPHSSQLFSGPIFAVSLLALPCIFRDRKMRFPLMIAAVVTVGVMLEVWTSAHYLAPATCLFFLLLVQCMRHLRLWRLNGRPLGAAWVRATPMLCVGMIVLRVGAVAAGAHIEPAWPRGNLERAAILRKLQAMPGRQLVIVRYAPDHGPHEEWVYNRADIDRAKVVWARDMGPQEDEPLLHYFKDRHVWTLCPDDSNPQLKTYPASEGQVSGHGRNLVPPS